MTNGFSFWDKEIWTFVLTITLILGVMLLANLLKRKIPFLRNSLLPSSVLGGFLALLLDWGYKSIFGESVFSLFTLEALTYHGLGLGFIALAWRHLDGVKGKKARRDVFNTATVTVGGYLIQAVCGLLISIVLFYAIGSFAASGALLPMGYGQGPGQSFNWGANFERDYGFVNGTSFGLAVAAMGFVSACVGGIIFLNRKGGKTIVRSEHPSMKDEQEKMKLEEFYSENEIPVAESMDKLTVQFGLVFLTYGFTYFSMWAVYNFLLLPIGGFALNTVNPIIWGFHFLIGTAWAILFKSIGDKLRKVGVMHREYTNNYLLNRLSGFMFDIMVVSSIASINLSAFKEKEFVIPLVLICIVGAVVTYLYVLKACRALFPDYSDEMFLTMYGMLTGTASTGIILLREIDPLYKTPASHNLIYQNLWAIVLGAPILLMLGVIAKSLKHTYICLALIIVLLLTIILIQVRQTKAMKNRKEK